MDYHQWNKCHRCSTSAKRAECLWFGVISQVKWVQWFHQPGGAHSTPWPQPSTPPQHPPPLAWGCSPAAPGHSCWHPRGCSPVRSCHQGGQTVNGSALLRAFCQRFTELRFPPVTISPPTSHSGPSNEHFKHPPQKGRKTRHFVYTISFMHLANAVPQLENLPQLLLHFEQNHVGLLMNSSAQNTLGGFSLNSDLGVNNLQWS